MIWPLVRQSDYNHPLDKSPWSEQRWGIQANHYAIGSLAGKGGDPAMSSVAPSGPAIRSQRIRAIAASTVGTTIEWYDFFLYGTSAALVFPTVFFPGHTLYSGVLLSFGTQFVGFVARPIGAMIFGHYGDRIGRKTTLISTLLLMGIATFLMGLMLSYAAIGAAAPILLSMEWGKQRWRGFMASWPQVGVPVGLLLSTGMVKLFSGVAGSSFDTW